MSEENSLGPCIWKIAHFFLHTCSRLNLNNLNVLTICTMQKKRLAAVQRSYALEHGYFYYLPVFSAFISCSTVQQDLCCARHLV